MLTRMMSLTEITLMPLLAEFSILGLPDLPNRTIYKHWTVKRRNQFKWKNLVRDQCVLHRLKDLKLQKAKLTFVRHSSKECDFDNLVTSFKGCQDGIVASGAIVDDKQINIGQPTYRWEYRPRKQGGMITIMIEKPD